MDRGPGLGVPACYDEKPRALRADELPTTEPVSSPVATMAQARDRPNAITYVKGTAAVRQLAAFIGPGTMLTAGGPTYLTRFGRAGSSARLDDLAGRVLVRGPPAGDLTGWSRRLAAAPPAPRGWPRS